MTTYTATFEETSFLPVRQYDVKTLDSLMRVIRAEKRNALYDLTVTLSKIERDDEMPIKGEIVDEVQFGISKNSPALQAEINKLNTEVAYRDRKIEQLGEEYALNCTEIDTANYRIRKLTEKECGRLMGVKDEDIDKIDKMKVGDDTYKLYESCDWGDEAGAIVVQLPNAPLEIKRLYTGELVYVIPEDCEVGETFDSIDVFLEDEGIL